MMAAAPEGANGGLRNLNADDLYNERVRLFQEFLDEDYGENEYKDRIRKMLATDERRLIVNINDLRSYNREYADGLLRVPMEYLPPFEKALKDIILSIHDPAKDGNVQDKAYYIGLEGSFGEGHVSPRNVSSKHLGKMIALEGIITRCSLVRPKVHKSVHYCEKTEMFHAREYNDGTSLAVKIPTGAAYPKEDDNGNPLTTEFGLCIYRDFQTVSLQEMPERAPAGQLPRPLDVILDDDLVDKVKPGDRVMIVGVYRSLGKHAASVSAMFRTMILANNIRLLGKQIQQPLISDMDIAEIRKIGKRETVFDLLAMSLAPSIYGHDYIKKATLLLLLGGMEKNLENGTHLRGDINMLLIGDPSTAKSQMLRFVLNIAPLAIATTGRGSSGVGLTAAVTQDKETGERTLEAGAMVLADRGVVCIDEFDKMNDVDRVAIHEVMEQQTVTIAKAGIHTSLNARCSVLAAANPVYGNYRTDLKPFENIALPDSLLSRFDLVFVVLDNTEEEVNRTVSDHVVRLHRYIQPGVEEGTPVSDHNAFGMRVEEDQPSQSEVFQKYNQLLHVGIRNLGGASGRKKKPEILSIQFVKKYIHYAKTRIRPVLTAEATEMITREYVELRGVREGEEGLHRTMPITARTLETLIRLSTAHAKARLSQKVEEADVEVAVEILKFALYKEVDEKKKKNKRVRVDDPSASGKGSDDENDDDDDDNDDGDAAARNGVRQTPARGAKRSGNYTETDGEGAPEGGDVWEMIEDDDVPLTRSSGRSRKSAATSQGGISQLIDDSQSQSQGMDLDDESTIASGSGSSSGLDSARFVPSPSPPPHPSPVILNSSPNSANLFKQHLSHLKRSREEQQLPPDQTVSVQEVVEKINRRSGGGFGDEEVKGILRGLSQNNLGVWYLEDDEGIIFT
ncbi:MCM DNA helicase complex subunit [Rhizophlyctis rosea]|uniref:DNA replication licensing factor MCM3 n=1 Tax=Rhizophlyctis rosea TaxID=64517 RepID=A0AAD5SBF3_9FUNG|nr:MCM DNA helicase complex subunit [Rhizophlyctis rosea]